MVCPVSTLVVESASAPSFPLAMFCAMRSQATWWRSMSRSGAVSSSELKARARRGEPIDEYCPPAVALALLAKVREEAS
jgi:hypothetical protein